MDHDLIERIITELNTKREILEKIPHHQAHRYLIPLPVIVALGYEIVEYEPRENELIRNTKFSSMMSAGSLYFRGNDPDIINRVISLEFTYEWRSGEEHPHKEETFFANTDAYTHLTKTKFAQGPHLLGKTGDSDLKRTIDRKEVELYQVTCREGVIEKYWEFFGRYAFCKDGISNVRPLIEILESARDRLTDESSQLPFSPSELVENNSS